MDWYIGSEWTQKSKGLRKRVLAIRFSAIDKPHEIAKVLIRVAPDSVQHLDGRPSKYLAAEHMGEEQTLEMGTALTPVDCYVEQLVRQMLAGERARCYIRTSGGGGRQTKSTQQAEGDAAQVVEEQPDGHDNDDADADADPAVISFELTLEHILETREIHALTPCEMHALALRYKEAGVAMFKTYPRFAHDYFARAAKCLISYKPFDALTLEADGIAAETLQSLFTQVQTNLAACLLAAQRYEDVIYQTQCVESTPLVAGEKSIYRRAVAYYNLKEFEAAQRTIEKVANYQERPEFVALHRRIAESWKASNDRYKTLVKRMFN